jgi:hypothetical protein
MSSLAKVGKLKGILQDPANRPAVSLLVKSSVAMAVLPLAVYFLCYNLVFAEGVRDSSEESSIFTCNVLHAEPCADDDGDL